MQAGADPEEALSTWLPSAHPSAGVGPSTSTRPLPNAAPRSPTQMELLHGEQRMREQSGLLHAPAGPQRPTHNTRDGWPAGAEAEATPGSPPSTPAPRLFPRTSPSPAWITAYFLASG